LPSTSAVSAIHIRMFAIHRSTRGSMPERVERQLLEGRGAVSCLLIAVAEGRC
jgi:hypothetical protein